MKKFITLLFSLTVFICTLNAQFNQSSFSHQRGLFENSFTLTLTPNEPNTTVRYTLDGSAPTLNSGQIYSTPISINETSVVRAIGWNLDDTSRVHTQSYIFPTQVLEQEGTPSGGYPDEFLPGEIDADYDMDPEILDDLGYSEMVLNALYDLPSISLVTNVEDLFDETTGIYMNTLESGVEWERPVSIEFFTPDGSEEDFQKNAGLRIAGSSSREPTETPKHSFRVMFKSQYGPSKLEYPLFGEDAADEFDNIALRAGFNFSWLVSSNSYDQRLKAQYIRDQYARELQLAMSGVAAHGRYVHLYLNGLYWGLYNLTERSDATLAAAYFGGDKDDYDAVKSGHAMSDSDIGFYETMLELAVDNDLSNQENYEELAAYIDLDNWIDYFILNQYMSNTNWDHHNWVMVRGKAPGSKARMLAWDTETSMIQAHFSIVEDVWGGKPTEILDNMRANEEFRVKFSDHIHRHIFNCGIITEDSVAAHWLRIADVINTSIAAESARWGDYRRDVHDVGDPALYTHQTWLDEQERLLTEFIPERKEYIMEEWREASFYPSIDAPIYSEACDLEVESGFMLDISNINPSGGGTIYYTIDGSDPREFGGSIAASATNGNDNATITINQTTTVKSRVKDGSDWSALQETTFYTALADQDALVINEIHYNPDDGSDYEFIELKNLGNSTIDLSGSAFDLGIEYAFPIGATIAANDFLVLAEDVVAFEAKYGFAAYGQYGGKLSNGGETVTLRDPLGNIIDEVTYLDTIPWDMDADGLGTSLEFLVGEFDNSLPENWHASAQIDGSPNAENGIRLDCNFPMPYLVINEINYHSDTLADAGDWLELYNPSSENINLSDWVFQDEGNTLTLPNNTNIGAGQVLVLVFDEAKFTALHPTISNYIAFPDFGLNNDGERLRLVNSVGCVADYVHFNDVAPWSLPPDGDGPSLQLISPNLDNNIATNWLPSNNDLGTPGIVNGADFTVNIGPDQAICAGNSIDLNASVSGCIDCNYQWSNGMMGAQITVNPTNTTTYSVVVTSGSDTANDAIEISIVPDIIITADVSNLPCADDNNGEINLTTSGGAGGFAYAWNTGDNTEDLTDLVGGTYSVTITDAAECNTTETFTIDAPQEAIEVSNTLTDIACNGTPTGAIDLFPTGGIGSFNFSWSNNTISQNQINLQSGTYTVTITDDNNCTHIETYIIDEPNALESDITVSNIDCNGDASGSIELNIGGGVGSYNYAWNTGDDEADLNNLSGGIYSVIVTDANNCELIENIEITEPSAIIANNTITDISCNGDENGSINVTASGGFGDLDYTWNIEGNTATQTGLSGGEYNLVITDENDCDLALDFVIEEPEAIDLGAITNHVYCGETDNGSIELAPTGGTGILEIEWNTGSNANSLENLSPGDYSVVITDESACQVNQTFTILEIPSLNIQEEISQIDCNGNTNGAINVEALGGTGTYAYLWETGETTPNLNNLSAGFYIVTITDDSDCEAIEVYEIIEPTAIFVEEITTSIDCNGNTNGAIVLAIQGGTNNFEYSWSNGATTPNIDELAANQYTVTITDNGACETIESYTISEPEALVLESIATNIDCFGNENGQIETTVSGGTSDYIYEWNTGEETPNLEGLSAGEYSVIITDINGCATTETVEISEPDALVIESQITNIDCFAYENGSIEVTITGGTGSIETTWNTGENTPSISNLPAGEYELTSIDENGCAIIETFALTEPTALFFDEAHTNPNMGADGTISVTPDGGTMPYTILWDNNATNFELTDLEAGTYTFVITDANGCESTGEVILEPNNLQTISNLENWAISPNPSAGHLQIQATFSTANAVQIEVYNVAGVRLLQATENASTNMAWQANLSDYAAGIYWVRLKTEQGTVAKKWVKMD